MGSPVLEARDLSVSYGDGFALAPQTFALEEGEHLAVTGPSGSGKTTLLRLLAGLIPPTHGELLADGQVVSRPGSALEPHRRSLGMLFQELALWPHLSVVEQVEFCVPPQPGRGARERRAHATAALERAGIEALAKRYPGELSGGERQRVAWARAIAPEPRLLVLDEPLTSLDPERRGELLDALEDYCTEPGRTVVLATHDPEVARRAARRHLHLGTVALGG